MADRHKKDSLYCWIAEPDPDKHPAQHRWEPAMLTFWSSPDTSSGVHVRTIGNAKLATGIISNCGEWVYDLADPTITLYRIGPLITH
jgi:hypothetical protein